MFFFAHFYTNDENYCQTVCALVLNPITSELNLKLLKLLASYGHLSQPTLCPVLIPLVCQMARPISKMNAAVHCRSARAYFNI